MGTAATVPAPLRQDRQTLGTLVGQAVELNLVISRFSERPRLVCFAAVAALGETLTKGKLGVNHRGRDLTQKGHIMPTTALVGLRPVGGSVCFLANWMQSGRTNLS